MKAPFPYFGGKSRVASEIWSRFGDVQNYVEPFCGSAAVLLARPTEPRIETVNDANCFIANFWRAVQADPEACARYADWPVNEADLHARHRWLMLSLSSVEWRERMKTDPDFYDVKVAGWWVWGASCWIGAGWCDGGRLFGRDGGTSNKKPETRARRGDTAALHEKRPAIANSGRGVASAGLYENTRPHVGTKGIGVHKRPRLTGWGETGVHALGAHSAATLDRRRPELSAGNGRGVTTASAIQAWFEDLSARLRRVRVVCGDWSRVLTPAVTTGIGVTGVFLDPPYSRLAGRTPGIYSHDDDQVANMARDWAIANAGDPMLRIALCGYEGEHVMPGWACFEWAAQGGYANQRKSGDGYANRLRERVWFSPACLRVAQPRLIA